MSNCTNIYQPIQAKVLEVFSETPTIKTIRFKPVVPISFSTGQFVEITIPGYGEAPFTPSSRPSEKNFLEVTVMKVDKVTEKIHQLKPGDTIGVRGPFGRGYPLEKFKGKDLIVVGGGCGFAPLRSLMYSLFDMRDDIKKLFFRGGCRNPQELIYKDETKSWTLRPDLNMRLTVDKSDESWNGDVGLVTNLLDNLDLDMKQAIAIVCGPPIMMKFTALKLLNLGVAEQNLYLSMEKNMSCGVGKCGHCRLGTFYCCKDGPVFTYNEIKNFHEIWD